MQAPKSGGYGGGDGIHGPLNPFVVTPPPIDDKEDEIPGYVKRFGAYPRDALRGADRIPTVTSAQHTLTEGVFLPAGTLLPKGASFAMQATIDFGLHFPKGTKVPGGFLLPVSVVKKEPPKKDPPPSENPFCSIQ
ncbi:hypothetical protein I316_08042 [Kwoniella heveanensis BCC8398]|uniref:Uncharacterized protein n=1 Tax=Kwoniella heveanensis BCC8398 TaxID=1296120 RepID=A0A1B9GGZ9_9TREE|nr:hypothetical protein I316_08042 [Kwoniella heveanensis BCC8398]